MNDFIVRPWRSEDVPQLAALWAEVFGDSQEYIDKFFSLFLKPGGCMVGQADGRAVSAMYIMDGPLLFPPEGRSLPTAYTYALATDPAYRGRGIGTAVYRACVRAALERADAACVLPAEPSLYDFYSRAAGCVPVSAVREAVFTHEELAGPAEDTAVPISAGEYYLRRKALLRGHPYAVMQTGFMALEGYHIQQFGGGFLSVDGDIAVVELGSDTCRVLELLSPEGDWQDVLRAVAALYPAARYEVRSPVYLPGPGEARPFMLAALRPDVPLPDMKELWWGFAFD